MEVESQVTGHQVPPRIVDYKCYREFMGDVYNYKKAQRSSFSYRQFASRVGVKSPNYMQLVIQGKRNLSNALASSVAKALGLGKLETKYFCALVAQDNAESVEAKDLAYRDVLVATRDLVSKLVPESQKNVLGQWYNLVIREMVALPDFQPDGEWISKRLRGLVSAKDAEFALNQLLNMGMLIVKDGQWVMEDPVITTGEAFDTIRVCQYHAQNLKLWSQALKDLMADEPEMGLLNISINSKKMPEFKEKVITFQKELIGWLSDEDSPDEVVQLGVYLMPLTRKI